MTASEPRAGAAAVLRVQGPSRLAFGATTLALVTLASLSTAALVKEGTAPAPGRPSLPLGALPPAVSAGPGAVVVERAPGSWRPAKPARLSHSVIDLLTGGAGGTVRTPGAGIGGGFTGTGVFRGAPGVGSTPNQPVDQPVVAPVTHPVPKPVTHPVTHHVAKPLTHHVPKPVTHPVHRPVTKPIDLPDLPDLSVDPGAPDGAGKSGEHDDKGGDKSDRKSADQGGDQSDDQSDDQSEDARFVQRARALAQAGRTTSSRGHGQGRLSRLHAIRWT